MNIILYIKFVITAKKRKFYWHVLTKAEINCTITLPLIEKYIAKLNACDETILKMKKRFGYRPFDKVLI